MIKWGAWAQPVHTLPVKTGDIWKEYDAGAWVIIPTNLAGVFGAGVARAAMTRAKEACDDYRRYVSNGTGFIVKIAATARMIFFPTKFSPGDPVADYALITHAAGETAHKLRLGAYLTPRTLVLRPGMRVVSPLLGCGLGRLTWEGVSPCLTVLDQMGVVFLKPGKGD